MKHHHARHSYERLSGLEDIYTKLGHRYYNKWFQHTPTPLNFVTTIRGTKKYVCIVNRVLCTVCSVL